MKSDETFTSISSLKVGNGLPPAGIWQRRGQGTDHNHVILCLNEHFLRRLEKGLMKLSFNICFDNYSALQYRQIGYDSN